MGPTTITSRTIAHATSSSGSISAICVGRFRAPRRHRPTGQRSATPSDSAKSSGPEVIRLRGNHYVHRQLLHIGIGRSYKVTWYLWKNWCLLMHDSMHIWCHSIILAHYNSKICVVYEAQCTYALSNNFFFGITLQCIIRDH